jgi:hypothetical protein
MSRVRLLILALLAASTSACHEAVVLGDGRSDEPDSATPSDAGADAAADASTDASADGSEPDPGVPSFTEPTLIEALAGAEEDGDDDPSLNEALTWIFFNSTREGGSGDEDIWFSRRDSASDSWGAPEPATALNSDARETGLALSEDGLTIYWSSDRDGGAGGLDIYTSQRATLDGPWSEPEAVSALNGSGDDLISAVHEGRLALLSRRDGDTDYHLWWARRDEPLEGWRAPEPIDEIKEGGDSDPFIVGEGGQLLFSREGDVHIARRPSESAPFAEPSPLPTLNSDGEDTDPWSDRDLTYIVFASDRSGEDRLYEARRQPEP